MQNNRYIDVDLKENANIPGRRILLKNPKTGNYSNRTRPFKGFKWVYDQVKNRFNQIPIRNNVVVGPVIQDPRIESWWSDRVDMETIDKLFPLDKINDRGLRFTPLRPSLYGLNVKFHPEMNKKVFSDLAYKLTTSPFSQGIQRVVVRGGSPWRLISDVKTKAQQNMINKSIFTNVKRMPSRIDVNMDGINIQIYRSSMLVNGGYKKDINIPLNRVNGRSILGEGLDVLEKFMKKYIPTKQVPYQDYFVSSMNLDFYVNQKITDPIRAAQAGRILYKNTRDFVKSRKNIDNDIIKLFPSFEYELEDLNFLAEAKNFGMQNKIPNNIYLKFNKNKKGGSYVAWKKGYIRIQGADSLAKILLIAKMVQAWYLDIKHTIPEILEDKPFGKRGVKRVGKVSPKASNIEKVKNVRLELYKGRKGDTRLKIDGIRCDDVSKKGYTTKQLRAIAEVKLIPGAAKLKRSVICKKLYDIAVANKNRSRNSPRVPPSNRSSNRSGNRSSNRSRNSVRVPPSNRSGSRSRNSVRPPSNRLIGAGVGLSSDNNKKIEYLRNSNAENELLREFENNSAENKLNLRATPTEFKEDLNNGNRQCIRQLENKGFTVTRSDKSAQERGEKLLNSIMYNKQRSEVKDKNFMSIYFRIEKETEEYLKLKNAYGEGDRRTRDAHARLRALQNAYGNHMVSISNSSSSLSSNSK